MKKVYDQTRKIPWILLSILISLSGCLERDVNQDIPNADYLNTEIEVTEDIPEPTGDEAEDSEETDSYKIGVTHYSLENEFINLIGKTQLETAAEYGVEISMYDANYDINTQKSQIDRMIREGIDAIILSPVDVDALVGSVDKAHEAGIPVICVNTKVNSSKLTSFIGSDDVTAGEVEMAYTAFLLGRQGNIVILEGQTGSSAAIQRKEGIYNVLNNYDNIHVLSEKTANWSMAEGMTLMENWLQAFPDKIDAVVCQNDEMALGAVMALEEKGMKEDVFVIGIDAISKALISIEEGKLDATIFQDPTIQGRTSIEVALDHLKGLEIQEAYIIPFELVSPANIKVHLEKRELYEK